MRQDNTYENHRSVSYTHVDVYKRQGLERITLLKDEIDDMRLLYENDDRFLKQFQEEKKNEYIIKMDQSFSSGT